MYVYMLLYEVDFYMMDEMYSVFMCHKKSISTWQQGETRLYL